MLVQDESGKVIRLSWEDEATKEKRRTLAPGTYVVRGYRLIRTDKNGKEWIVSASAPKIKELSIEAGKEARISLDEIITFGSGLKVRGDKIDVMMQFQGEGHSGVTVYAAGRRIPVTYRIVSAEGKEIASGAMTYG